MPFFGGFQHDSHIDPFINTLQNEQYGDYTPMAGQKAINKSARQVARGGDIFQTGFGAGALSNATNIRNNENMENDRLANTAQFGTLGNSTYNDRIKAQSRMQTQNQYLQDLDRQRQMLMGGLFGLAGQGADRKNQYTNNEANFRLNRDEGAIRGYQGSTNYQQGLGGQLLGGAINSFLGGFGGGAGQGAGKLIGG